MTKDKVPNFDNGNPEFPVPEGVRSYAVTETHAWRCTKYNDGRVLVECAPVGLVDVLCGGLWEPWNDPIPNEHTIHWVLMETRDNETYRERNTDPT